MTRSYVWFLSSYEECGRRGEVNHISTCDSTFDLHEERGPEGGEMIQMFTWGISVVISGMWRWTYPFDGS